MELFTKNRILELPESAIQEIRKMYDLDKPGRIDDAVDMLENWIQKQDHIVKKDFNRLELEKSIVTCKGSVEKAKKQIDRLCTMRTLLPHFFEITNLNIEFKDVFDTASIVLLPKPTPDLYRVIIEKVYNKRFSEKLCLNYYRYNLFISEYEKAHDYVNGFIIILDFQDVDIVDLLAMSNPVYLQQYMTITIEGHGARLKGLYVVTQSKVIDLFTKMIKTFLSRKIADRFHIIKTLEELHKVVPKDILPIEYEGKERPLKKLSEEWINELVGDEHVRLLKTKREFCTNEKLRQSGQVNEEYMGTPGSFRNMTVD